MCDHSIASQLRAVKERAFLVVPFSGSTLGVRVGALAFNLAEAFAALKRRQPLPALEFSLVNVPIANGGGSMASTLSGLKVFDTLPTFEGTNLETTCPGSALNLQFADLKPGGAGREAILLPSWAVALLVILGVVLAAVVLGLVAIVKREKSGDPVFAPVLQHDSGVEMRKA